MLAIQFSGSTDDVLTDFRALAALVLRAPAAGLGDATMSNSEKKSTRTKPTLTSGPSTPEKAEPTPSASESAAADEPTAAATPTKVEDPFHVKLTAELITKKGVTVTKKVLDSYKVAKASLLRPEQIEAYVKDVEALIVAR